jgi:hypothetical protein
VWRIHTRVEPATWVGARIYFGYRGTDRYVLPAAGMCLIIRIIFPILWSNVTVSSKWCRLLVFCNKLWSYTYMIVKHVTLVMQKYECLLWVNMIHLGYISTCNSKWNVQHIHSASWRIQIWHNVFHSRKCFESILMGGASAINIRMHNVHSRIVFGNLPTVFAASSVSADLSSPMMNATL